MDRPIVANSILKEIAIKTLFTMGLKPDRISGWYPGRVGFGVYGYCWHNLVFIIFLCPQIRPSKRRISCRFLVLVDYNLLKAKNWHKSFMNFYNKIKHFLHEKGRMKDSSKGRIFHSFLFNPFSICLLLYFCDPILFLPFLGFQFWFSCLKTIVCHPVKQLKGYPISAKLLSSLCLSCLCIV